MLRSSLLERSARLLDTDIGDDIDDAYALCLLMAEKANVIGVSTVYRNAVKRARIASALISLWGENIPVYAGESYPDVQLRFSFFRFQNVHFSPVPKPAIP